MIMNTKSFKSLFKTVGMLFGLLLVYDQANSQALEPSKESPQLETYDFHLKKYHDNLKAGKILFIAGGVTGLAGAIITLAETDHVIWEAVTTGESEGSALGPSLMIGGGVVMLASIPFYIKAKEHEKKANLLIGTSQSALKDSRINLPKNIGVSVVIPIN